MHILKMFESPLKTITNTFTGSGSSPPPAPAAPKPHDRKHYAHRHALFSEHSLALDVHSQEEDDVVLSPAKVDVDLDIKRRLIVTPVSKLRRKLSALEVADENVQVFAVDRRAVPSHAYDVRFATEMRNDQCCTNVFGPTIQFNVEPRKWSDFKLEQLLGIVHFAESVAMWLLDVHNVAIVSFGEHKSISEFVNALILSYLRKVQESNVCGTLKGVPQASHSTLNREMYVDFCNKYEEWSMRDTSLRATAFFEELLVNNKTRAALSSSYDL